MKKPTIYDIKRGHDGYYFNKDTLRFFKQTMKSFTVFKTNKDDIFMTSAKAGKHTSICYWRRIPEGVHCGKFEKLGTNAPEGVEVIS